MLRSMPQFAARPVELDDVDELLARLVEAAPLRAAGPGKPGAPGAAQAARLVDVAERGVVEAALHELDLADRVVDRLAHADLAVQAEQVDLPGALLRGAEARQQRVAPSASSFVLISSASAFAAASLITLGAASTRSLASLRPRPVASRTTLITLTLLGPTSVSSTSNSSFSSAAAAPAPAPAAATTTPAAADTPNSSSHAFTRSFNSNTVNSLIASMISAVDNFAIVMTPFICL